MNKNVCVSIFMVCIIAYGVSFVMKVQRTLVEFKQLLDIQNETCLKSIFSLISLYLAHRESSKLISKNNQVSTSPKISQYLCF